MGEAWFLPVKGPNTAVSQKDLGDPKQIQLSVFGRAGRWLAFLVDGWLTVDTYLRRPMVLRLFSSGVPSVLVVKKE